MSLKIAIQPDKTKHRKGGQQSYSARWHEIAPDYNVETVPVDVFSDDALDQIAKCDAFMWRFLPSAHPRLFAKRLLHSVRQGLGLPTFPTPDMFWHAEDKVGQAYLLKAAGIPTPETYVFWHREAAERFCETTDYPFVLKLATGYRAVNVRLVHNRAEARYYIDQMFGSGAVSLGYNPAPPVRLFLRRMRAASELLRGRHPNAPNAEADMQHGYLYAQEFLADNSYDVRVIIMGNRAFPLRRFNRPGDFRASGSGIEDWDPGSIGEDVIRVAFQAANRLGLQSVALDVLRRGSEPVVAEMGFAHPTWTHEDCRGYWSLDGDPATGALHWNDEMVRAEDAIFDDFVRSIRNDIV